MQQTCEQSQDWVRRIARGDPEAESELVAYYSHSIHLILLKRTGNTQLAKDLSQDTFMVLLRKLRADELNKPESLSAFVQNIAVNVCIQHFRKEKRYIYSADEIIDQQVALKDNKEDSLDGQEARKLLDETLEQLAVPRDRELLRRFFLLDEDKAEICGDLELSSVHFDRVLYRAKQRMRDLIEHQEGLKALLFGGLYEE